MSFGRTFAVILCWGFFMLLFLGIGLRMSLLPRWRRINEAHQLTSRRLKIGAHKHVHRVIGKSVKKPGPAPEEPPQHSAERPRAHVKGAVPLSFIARKDDKYFLYDQLLSKEHSFNQTNIESFRRAFSKTNGDLFTDLVVDQSNTNVGSKLFFYIKPKKTSFLKVKEDFHEHLPKKVDMSNLGTCAVIGNGGILAHGSCGQEIDETDFVFRCNAAPLKAFVTAAGLKTNVTSLNPSILNSRYGSIKKKEMLQQFVDDMQEYKGYLLASCFGASWLIDVCLKAFKNYTSAANTFVMAHPKYFTNITEVWSRFNLTSRPSTGLYLTTAAVLSCEEVHLYGFWPFPLTPGSVSGPLPYHYFDDMKFPTEFKVVAHDMDKEFATLIRLHAHGVIRLHIDDCS